MPVSATTRYQSASRQTRLSMATRTEETDEDAMSYRNYLDLCAERGVKPLPCHSWQQWCEVLGITMTGSD
jgi:hypothetical protein